MSGSPHPLFVWVYVDGPDGPRTLLCERHPFVEGQLTIHDDGGRVADIEDGRLHKWTVKRIEPLVVPDNQEHLTLPDSVPPWRDITPEYCIRGADPYNAICKVHRTGPRNLFGWWVRVDGDLVGTTGNEEHPQQETKEAACAAADRRLALALARRAGAVQSGDHTPPPEQILADLRAACSHGLIEAGEKARRSKSPEFLRAWEMRARTLREVLAAIGYQDIHASPLAALGSHPPVRVEVRRVDGQVQVCESAAEASEALSEAVDEALQADEDLAICWSEGELDNDEAPPVHRVERNSRSTIFLTGGRAVGQVSYSPADGGWYAWHYDISQPEFGRGFSGRAEAEAWVCEHSGHPGEDSPPEVAEDCSGGEETEGFQTCPPCLRGEADCDEGADGCCAECGCPMRMPCPGCGLTIEDDEGCRSCDGDEGGA